MPTTSDKPLADDTLARLRAVSVATVTMQLLKRGLRHTFIQGARPLNPQHARFAAEAYTLRTIPMREDLSTPEVLADPEYPQRKAIEACPPGQVLVCDSRGEQRAGMLGDILITRLMVRGVAAVATDGPMRDAAAVAAAGDRHGVTTIGFAISLMNPVDTTHGIPIISVPLTNPSHQRRASSWRGAPRL